MKTLAGADVPDDSRIVKGTRHEKVSFRIEVKANDFGFMGLEGEKGFAGLNIPENCGTVS
eukprot:CAMPEP_0170196470 /NCGR_PEP_ID=MMETSP0040_2-20121228/64050_1 /TAXON_ID=641309 /ORGANISM="Lotharella oceanica, Strain CCMP622" /LENGTH=59 /DNA_ID=CAMNT_0010445891 /DNA_START=594 /DNA_END=773 /DNA_ORIENTATION=+